jgi:quinoprotein glucose dehydrogenase
LFVPLFLIASHSAQLALTQTGTQSGEWRVYGGDSGNTKYAPLTQIDRTNVDKLKIVWRWKTDNFGESPEFLYEATPLMVNGVLYTTAG